MNTMERSKGRVRTLRRISARPGILAFICLFTFVWKHHGKVTKTGEGLPLSESSLDVPQTKILVAKSHAGVADLKARVASQRVWSASVAIGS